MRLLITGGSSDIGKAIALRRLEMKDEIIITASSNETLQAAKDEFAKLDRKVDGFVFDLENPEASKSDINQLLSSGLDGVIFNAATRLPKLRLFDETKADDFTKFFTANTLGNFWLLREILPKLAEQEFGRLIFISSLVATSGTSRYGAYCAAKAALEGLFLNLAVDYGHKNILSTIVRPGIIATERNRRYWTRTGYIEKASALIPQGKIGTPAQVAEAIDPLLSKTSYMNGAVIEVSGGFPKFRTGALV